MSVQEPAINQIFLRDHIREVEIGAFAEERAKTQRLSFTAIVDVSVDAHLDDDVDRILSYDEILAAIDAQLGVERMALLETLAEGIAYRILEHERALRASVTIEKLDRVSGALGVTVSRKTGKHAIHTSAEPEGSVFCLSIGDGVPPDLPPGAIIAIEGAPPIESLDEITKLRVQMIESDKTGWILSSETDDLPVVGSRTELEHIIRSGQAAIWAPSKMVFDAAEGIYAMPHDFGQICAWLAQSLNAKELVFVGRPAPCSHSFEGVVRAS